MGGNWTVSLLTDRKTNGNVLPQGNFLLFLAQFAKITEGRKWRVLGNFEGGHVMYGEATINSW